MTGYRQHSFDPNAYEQPGRPLRPFNWVQWLGVALGGIGLILTTLQVAGLLGWIPRWVDGSPPLFILLLLGVTLVNSRREPGTLVDDAQRDRNRKVLLITIAICAALLGAALVIELQGA